MRPQLIQVTNGRDGAMPHVSMYSVFDSLHIPDMTMDMTAVMIEEGLKDTIFCQVQEDFIQK